MIRGTPVARLQCDHEAGNGAAPLQECRLSPRVSSAPADVGDQNRIASYQSVTPRIPFVAPKPHGLLHVARNPARRDGRTLQQDATRIA
jgi:hypothetical protein